MVDTAQDAYICVEHVRKTFRTAAEELEVLSDISFSVRQGEITCIVGTSGCGKSTLLRGIAGIDPDYEGQILVNGQQVKKPTKHIGMVFQEHRLFPWLTVEENIKFALNSVSGETKEELTRKYIRLVGLEGFEKSYPSQLSGGMAQRGGIARALVNQPPVLLLDEPFGALDAFTKITMQNELKQIQKTAGTTMLLVTHDIDEAVYLADQVIVLSARPGKIKCIVKVELSEPRDRNSFEFLNIRRKIYRQFFEEVERNMEYNI